MKKFGSFVSIVLAVAFVVFSLMSDIPVMLKVFSLLFFGGIAALHFYHLFIKRDIPQWYAAYYL